MLSRVADSLFWMSRYVERAENVARFLAVNDYLSLDLPGDADIWEPLVSAAGDRALFGELFDEVNPDNVAAFMSSCARNPNSILSAIREARSNARSVREFITIEMWEQLNGLYLMLRSLPPDTRIPAHRLNDVIRSCQLLFGIADATMSHGEGWQFTRMGRSLERADKTSRIVDVRYFLLIRSGPEAARPYDDILWAALLRSISGLEMYRKQHRQLVPYRVFQFLMLDKEFPRSVHHCIISAEEAVRAISDTPIRTFQNRAEQLLGRLRAELDYLGVDEIIAQGVHEFVDEIQFRLNGINDAIFETFFALADIHKPQETA
jgi:uncharacterized alpha-E superfamily protein